MTHTHIQETARRLGVEQYFALKAAEVTPRARDADKAKEPPPGRSKRPGR